MQPIQNEGLSMQETKVCSCVQKKLGTDTFPDFFPFLKISRHINLLALKQIRNEGGVSRHGINWSFFLHVFVFCRGKYPKGKGTYVCPLIKQRRNFSGTYNATYHVRKAFPSLHCQVKPTCAQIPCIYIYDKWSNDLVYRVKVTIFNFRSLFCVCACACARNTQLTKKKKELLAQIVKKRVTFTFKTPKQLLHTVLRMTRSFWIYANFRILRHILQST